MYRVRTSILNNFQRDTGVLQKGRYYRRGQSGQLCNSKRYTDIQKYSALV